MKRSLRSLLALGVVMIGVSACQPYESSGVPTPSHAAVIADPNALKGTSSQQVERLFGKPVRERRDPPAVVWQYIAGKSCVLDVFLYEENGEGKPWLQTAYAQARAGQRNGAAQTCVQTLLERSTPAG